ncbi:MAG: adaptor protein MecA [Lachnospiraceae bacterium]|nr:adaptor protein MecA [Lachnospiraceae bacterium]
MKIEKVNENQIRCTLTREDLASRELKISELAYGTEKAKSLFRDMMQQASFEFGFEAEDIPLMIEAIPLNSECIVLIITKVEDPEELDTRFSKFSPAIHDDSDKNLDDMLEELSNGADEVLDLFKRIHEGKKANSKQTSLQDTAKAADPDLIQIFIFDSLGSLVDVSAILSESYSARNSLYKDEEDGRYLLVISKGDHTPEEFTRVCNVLSEHGSTRRIPSSTYSFLEEHYMPLIADHAIQSLSQMN